MMQNPRVPGDALAAFAEEPGAGISVGQVLEVLRRHWRLLVLSLALGILGGSLHYAVTPKEYRAATIIQIERKSLTSVTGNSNPWLESYWNTEYYPTQYRLLQSRGLAERTARLLRLQDDPTAPPGAGPKGSPNAAADEAAIGALAGGILGGLEVTPLTGTELVEIGYRSRDPELAARIANGLVEAFIDFGIESRTETTGKASTFLAAQIDTIKQEISDKEAQLTAYGRTSDIVSLDPESNTVLQRLKALNTDYISALSARIEKESRYNELLSSPPEAIADSLVEGTSIATLRADQASLEREYQTRLDTYKPEWPAMVELKAKIDRGQSNLVSAIAAAVAKARETARAEYQTAQRQEQSLAAQLEKTKSETLALSSASVEYSNLQLEVSTRRSLLDQLMTRQSETEVAARLQGARQSNVHVVDRALVPGGPFRPSLRKDLTMGMLIGVLLGLSSILLIEFLDRTVKTTDEAERLLGLPVLAVVPDVSERQPGRGYGRYIYGYGYGYGYGQERKSGGSERKTARSGAEPTAPEDPDANNIELMPHSRPRLVASEAYRSLRTALLLSSAEQLKIVAVTSSQSGEGKTASATNLAVVMAQLGGRVLLVDADLRKPRLHTVFKLSNRVGLVNYLTGTAQTEHIFLPTPVPGLFVTPSGPIPPNPSELLASQRMRELTRYLRATFDFVVIDTPPALAVTDPTIVGAVVDGIILCLRCRKVLREDARACRDRLRLADIRILGTVLNRYRELHGGYGKRYQHYVAYAADDDRTPTAA
jgi:capsular exopolysaccharide synthesis family protein